MRPTPSSSDHFRVAVVGSGFAGLAVGRALHRRGVDFAILERAGTPGGTWQANTYPGCRCDVPSHLYSYSFAPNPDWPNTYSHQPEIRAYLDRCAEEFGLLPHIRFGHEVSDAHWDDGAQRWRLDTSQGPVTADVLVLGNGPLSEPAVPDITGLDEFEGAVFHSARWDHDHDLSGKRVAVIGTGASAIQFVPEIQPDVGQLTLFQRTPAWVLPHPGREIGRRQRALFRRLPVLQRLVRAATYWAHELVILGFVRNPRLTRIARRAGAANIARHIADDALRAKLTPRFDPGCKRVLLSNDYYRALAQPNVDVVTEAIREVRPNAVLTADGVEHEVDTIILGTGFRVTDNPIAAHIKGRSGQTLHDQWAESGMQAYLGTTIPGFPNLFMMTGPNTGIGHTSLVFMMESQLPYILGALDVLDRSGTAAVEVRPEVCAAFNEQVQQKMEGTVWSTGGCQSWYLDVHGRNTTLWPDFTFRYRQRLRRFDVESYEVGA